MYDLRLKMYKAYDGGKRFLSRLFAWSLISGKDCSGILQVGIAISVSVAIPVGRIIRVQAMCLFPRVGHAVLIAVKGAGKGRSVGQPQLLVANR